MEDFFVLLALVTSAFNAVSLWRVLRHLDHCTCSRS
jgi:hypothetical protein